MEDGPKLLPQWLRGSSSTLQHRGETSSDTSKRGKVAAGPESSAQRSASQGDPWLPRGGSGSATNGIAAVSSGAVSGRGGPPDFGGAARGGLDRAGISDRSWKPLDSGYPHGSSGSRSGYVPAGLKSGGRDDRDGISLKPGGGYGSAGRLYGRVGESDGGRMGDRAAHDGWQSARATALAGTGGGVGGGGGVSGHGRGEDGSLSPLRAGAALNGSGGAIAAVALKASFEADFPSLRSAPSPSLGLSGSPGPQQQQEVIPAAAAATAAATLSAAASGPSPGAPFTSASSSPLLDTASSAAVQHVPYRQTFLSSRTTSSWTSKLAEAPAVSPLGDLRTASGLGAEEDIRQEAPAAAAANPSPSHCPPPAASMPVAVPAAPAAAGTPIPAAPAAPVPVVPPRPSGVWGTAASAAAVAAAAGADAHQTGASGGVGVQPSAAVRTRSEQLSARQLKQLVPVMSSGAAKSRVAAGLGGGGGGIAAGGVPMGGRAAVAVPKLVVPTAGLLKMATAGKRDDAAAGPGGGGGPGVRVLANSAVILSKKASQPLDQPLALTRSVSASAAAVIAAAGPAPALSATVAGPGARIAAGSGTAGLGAAGCSSVGTGRGGGSRGGSSGGSGISPPPEQLQHRAGQPETLRNPTPPPQQLTPDMQLPAALASATRSALLQVPEEEEAFLRSLGWTAVGEDGDGEDAGLTEEEIAAFRAQQQRQMAAAAAAGGSLAADARAAPKAVPAAAARRRGRPLLIVAASYGSEQVSSSSDSDSECE